MPRIEIKEEAKEEKKEENGAWEKKKSTPCPELRKKGKPRKRKRKKRKKRIIFNPLTGDI